MPLGSHVAEKTKARIWRHEYVDVFKLLHTDIQAKEGSKEEEWELARRPRVLITMDNWTSAFLIYASIYCERFLDRAIAMFKYMDIIRKAQLHFGGFAWLNYDEFRARVSINLEKPWGDVDSELWMQWMASSHSAASTHTASGLPVVDFAHDTLADSSMSVPNVEENIRSRSVSRLIVLQNSGERQGVEGAKALLHQRAPTPIRLEALLHWLRVYPDTDTVLKLEWGFREGFRVGYQGPRHRRWVENLQSAKVMPEVVLEKVQKEVGEGRIAGPFYRWPLENLIISPLGVVPKKNKGEFRLIHHLSWPKGESVNDFIAPEDTKVVYASVDDAIRIIRGCGKQAELAKCDIKAAFRLLPIHPEDFALLGMQMGGQYM
ncbi:hypothetical protein NDU88_005339 [Pleurodeles waltl]|uniref:Reverse transcriptase domain-containing protein n=1 Tax=Pleurodeles waltl TaxID=8319 RepID=A0AAV7X0X2_PLEWA|nr:hypothetical protein NDU88_005339 [Pleurodeles waltl]